jgi:asparagine synthase (glutamine-hydrolysing)
VLMKELYLYYKNFKNFYPYVMSLFIILPDRIKFFFWKTFINKWINHHYLEEVCGEKRDPRWDAMNLKKATIMTLFTTSLPHLLRWEDKNSMRWSIESRPTFMDVHLVETALSLLPEDKLQNGSTKVLFKKAVSEFLPHMILERKDKIGFETPIDDFFRDRRVITYCTNIIYSDSFKNRQYWHWNLIDRIFKEHIEKKSNSGVEIWKWINLELWLREY